jgi:hypothetical protein
VSEPHRTFFVPGATSDEDAERRYNALALRAGAEAQPDPAQRIYSISYPHDGEQWTATVGVQLRGERTRQVRRGGKRVTRRERFHIAATVLAIFRGVPYKVMTDARTFPYLAGQPSDVIPFNTP